MKKLIKWSPQSEIERESIVCVAHENQRLNNMYSFIKYIKAY